MSATLLVAFRKLPVLQILPESGIQTLLARSKLRDRGHGHLPGFFDWLWDDGRLVGVRFWPAESTIYMISEVAQLPYVSVHSGVSFDVIFRAPQPTAVTSTEDQDFGGQVLDLLDGTLAMTFDLSWVSEDVLDAFRSDDAIRWEE